MACQTEIETESQSHIFTIYPTDPVVNENENGSQFRSKPVVRDSVWVAGGGIDRPALS